MEKLSFWSFTFTKTFLMDATEKFFFFFFVFVKFLVCNDSKLRIQWPEKKNNIQFCVFFFFWFVGVYKVEGKKKSLQIRLFFL